MSPASAVDPFPGHVLPYEAAPPHPHAAALALADRLLRGAGVLALPRAGAAASPVVVGAAREQLRAADHALLRTLAEQVAEVRSAVVLPDVGAAHGDAAVGRVAAFLGVPLHDAYGAVCGAVCAIDAAPRRWTRADERVLEATAAIVGPEIGRGVAIAGPIGVEGTLRMLQTAVENMQLGVTVTDMAGRIIYTNPAEARMHGYTVGELVGQPASRLGAPELQRPLHSLWVQAAGRWTRESVNVTRAGVRFPVLLWSDLLLDAAGRPIGIVTCAEDITERKAAANALRRSEERYRQFFEDDLTANVVASPEGCILECNSAFARVFGFGSPGDACDVDIASLQVEPRAWRALLDQLSRERKVQQFEHAFRRVDGSDLHAVVNIAGEFDEEGRLTALRAYLFDVTERKQLEDQLRQAQRMEAIGRLAGGIAHDFNNVLTAISGHTQLLLDACTLDEAWRWSLQEVKKGADRATSLTRQLLAFSRQQVLRPQVLDLNEIVRGMAGMLERLIGADVILHFRLAEPLGAVRADAGQIEQVIMNLAVNARDAMPNGGRVLIETDAAVLSAEDASRYPYAVAPGRYVALRVTDDGSGMDAATRSRIFEPFFTTKEIGKGTGLGLSTVYGIVKQSGGYIWVESAPGQGSCFRVYLPMSDEHAAAAAAPPEPQQPAVRGVETVLLAEDEPAIQDLCRRVLERNGYTVLAADDGDGALALAGAHQGAIDLLVTDMLMPGMHGVALAERLLETHPHTRVLYMSGYTEDSHRELGVGTRHDFLQKPFSPTDLLARVRSVLDAPAP